MQDPYPDRPVDSVPTFQSLRKVTIVNKYSGGDYLTDDDLALAVARWFERNPRLESFELRNGDSYRSFRRGTTLVEYDSLDNWADDEWLRYQDDDYSLEA